VEKKSILVLSNFPSAKVTEVAYEVACAKNASARI
jgi:hypothetical protein